MSQPTKHPHTSSVTWMTTRKPPPRKQANVEWLFHKDNGAIYHDIDNCDICHCWRTHYHDENGKTGMFEQACSDHKHWFRHKVLISLDGTDGHQELAAQSWEIEELREASTLECSSGAREFSTGAQEYSMGAQIYSMAAEDSVHFVAKLPRLLSGNSPF
ncbi:hypothetical protein EI94DRAFT_1700554 [Lactarius quietus]|nr:hypothetical protein EI94DRAFT_1700554 [Lactarius quietus]